jgi:hypothetical protein
MHGLARLVLCSGGTVHVSVSYRIWSWPADMVSGTGHRAGSPASSAHPSTVSGDSGLPGSDYGFIVQFPHPGWRASVSFDEPPRPID